MSKLVLSLILLTLWSCSNKKFESELNSLTGQNSKTDAQDGTDTEPTVDPIDTEPPAVSYKFVPLVWETKNTASPKWSNYIYNLIRKEQSQMLAADSTSDIQEFCPKYVQLSDDERLNFWGQLFAAVAKFESGWNPASRMVETTMGTDPITGRQVASEGLLQLSYQDDQNYGNICDFNWSKDKFLKDNDPKKTIFDPYINLSCGIRIMAKQLKNKGSITLSSNVYWAVLKIGGKYEKISEIAAITKTLPFCQ